MPLPKQLQQLTRSKPALAGVVAAAGLGGYALYRKTQDGGTTDAAPTAAATSGGPATFDSTGTDIASAIGSLGGGLQLQLAGLQTDINEALARFPTGGDGSGTVDVGPGTGVIGPAPGKGTTGGVIGIPRGEIPGKGVGPVARTPPKAPAAPPKKEKAKAPAPKPVAQKTVTVKSGNTLSAIAKTNKTTLAALKKLNPTLFNKAHQSGNLIKPGEKVRVK